MPHDLTHRPSSPTPTPSAARRRPTRRLVVVRRRGVILVFVVVLLTLLAIMGTAYLATSRLDRQAIVGRGALPGTNTPLLPDRTKLDSVAAAVEQSVSTALIKDLFNNDPADDLSSMSTIEAFIRFRQIVGGSFYLNYDAPGRSDAWLSSLLPRRLTGPGAPVAWPWIGSPLRGNQATDGVYLEKFFSDPRRMTAGGIPTTYRYVELGAGRYEADAVLAQRHNAIINSVTMPRGTTQLPTRVYPGLIPGSFAITAANTAIAGDADGDGIADSGLIPIQINPLAAPAAGASIDRYLDRANNVIYFASYRIVDNSAKINVATALSNFGEYTGMTFAGGNEHQDGTNDELRRYLANEPGTPAFPVGAVGPNYGFFRANVGLTELIRQTLGPINPASDAAGFNPAQAELRRLVDARFPLLRQAPGTGYDAAETVANGLDIEKVAMQFGLPAIAQFNLGTNAGVANPAGYPYLYQYRSFGDLLETQVARLPGAPGSYLWSNGVAVSGLPTSALNWLGFSGTQSLAAKGGALVNPLISTSTVEEALSFSTRLSAANVNNNGEAPWLWFPPNAIDLWFGWTQQFEPEPGATVPTINVLDLASGDPGKAFAYTTATGRPAGMADVQMPRSPRALLTTYSGVTSAVPQRADLGGDAPGVPLGMPAYRAANIDAAAPRYDPNPNFWYPPTKVSAATGTKEQLWRAFWSAMTQMDELSGLWVPAQRTILPAVTPPIPYNPDHLYDAFRSPDRYATAEVDNANINGIDQATDVLTARQMALIRSAIAACNTIDLRDSDNDITAMTVDITDNHTAPVRYIARVFGTEKQLVISGVYMEQANGGGGEYVAVEIYNPTDIPLPLATYQLQMVDRDLAGDKATGTITATGGVGAIALGAAGEYLQPGGYLIVSNIAGGTAGFTPPPPAENATPPATQIRQITTATDLTTLLTGPRDKELMLVRTRRGPAASGAAVAFTDGSAASVRTPAFAAIENEVLTDPLTLVPVDAVDFRLGLAPRNTTDTPIRFLYKRTTPTTGDVFGGTAADPLTGTHAAERPGAWRAFYAGRFYDTRPVGGTARTTTSDATGRDSAVLNFAWRQIDPAGPAVTTFGAANDVPLAGRTEFGTILAPPIPIQNFTPLDPYTVTNTRDAAAPSAPYTVTKEVFGGTVPDANRGLFHLINKFPFASPFARDGDLLSIPYIGSYKIYRVTGGTPALYEYVPLPMDAVSVAPDPAVVAFVGGEVKTVGRFDPRTLPPGSQYDATAPKGIANEWASSLTDFISARHAPYRQYLPDVPDASRVATYYTSATGATAADDQRFQQDGPVLGTGAANPYPDTRWITFAERDPSFNGTDGQIPEDSVTNARDRRGSLRIDSTEASLIQGLINVNTAPQIVLRQLPWVVNSTNGLIDFLGSGDARDLRLRELVQSIDDERTTKTDLTNTWNPATDPGRTFGFPSVLSIVQDPEITTAPNLPSLLQTQPTGNGVTANDLMRMGMLNPLFRGPQAENYLYDTLNLNRVSNLTSTRSDVFTVYVTVQAWSWEPGNQERDTRLVGERRSSFVVDRSRINQTRYGIGDLIVLPVERE